MCITIRTIFGREGRGKDLVWILLWQNKEKIESFLPDQLSTAPTFIPTGGRMQHLLIKAAFYILP
jgi:hypothetical protein